MPLTFREGTIGDTELFLNFLDDIKAGMAQQEWFYLDPPEIVRAMMQEKTMAFWLAMDEHNIAAVFSVLFPGLHDHNYGYDLGLCQEELQQVIHMDTAAVHPAYRGLGLQGQMVHLAEKALSGKGKRILLSTVHPENTFSLNNMQRQGYVIQKRVGKYGSERYILRKDIF